MKTSLYIIISLVMLLPINAMAEWRPGVVLTTSEIEQTGVDSFFEISVIDDNLMARMSKGGSFPPSCTVKRENLRYLKILHYNYEGQLQTGELVCNKSISDDMISIFKELFEHKYQLQRVVLIDDYGADDETSMRNGNTSSFCFRRVKGSKNLSKHSLGLAIDINPIENPCVKIGTDGKLRSLEPNTAEARKHAFRKQAKPHEITRDDLCYKLFISHGFRWGGSWKSKKDYQHFEK